MNGMRCERCGRLGRGAIRRVLCPARLGLAALLPKDCGCGEDVGASYQGRCFL